MASVTPSDIGTVLGVALVSLAAYITGQRKGKKRAEVSNDSDDDDAVERTAENGNPRRLRVDCREGAKHAASIGELRFELHAFQRENERRFAEGNEMMKGFVREINETNKIVQRVVGTIRGEESL